MSSTDAVDKTSLELNVVLICNDDDVDAILGVLSPVGWSKSSQCWGLGVLMFERQGAGELGGADADDDAKPPAVSGLKCASASRVELASANMFSSMSIVMIMLLNIPTAKQKETAKSLSAKNESVWSIFY